MMSRRVCFIAGVVFVMTSLILPGLSYGKNWRYASFLPPPHWSNYCNSWLLNEIEKASNGEIKTQMFVSEALGKAREHYNMVVTGRAEVAEFTAGFDPGAFPLCDFLQLPFSWNQSLTGSIVANDLLRKGVLDKTFSRDVKVISLNLTEPLRIWTRKPVRNLGELKGLQLRVSGGLDAKTIEALGATAIMMPLPEVYPALQRGVLDGVLTGICTGFDFKFNEVCKYIMDAPTSIAVHMHVMNKKLWDSLSPDLQQKLSRVFHENEFHWSATVDILEAKSRREALGKHGVTIYEPAAAELEAMIAATAHVKDVLIADVEKKGLAGKATHEALLTSMRNHGFVFNQSWVKNRALPK